MDNDRSSQPRRPFLENPYQMYVGTVTLVIGAAKAASGSHGKWIAGALILHILSILSAMSYDHVHAVAATATRWCWTIILLSGTLCLYILLCLIFASEVFVKPMIAIGVMYLVYAVPFLYNRLRLLFDPILRYLPTSAQMASTDDIAVWMEEGRHRRED